MNAIGTNHILYKESSDECRHVEKVAIALSANIIILLHSDDKVKECTQTKHCSRLHIGNTWELVCIHTLANS